MLILGLEIILNIFLSLYFLLLIHVFHPTLYITLTSKPE